MRRRGQIVVLVIGAARSGTKLLRDSLASGIGADSVPYDVNYLWRLGNERATSDQLDPASLSAQQTARIRREVLAFNRGAGVLVEKTVSNSLRVPFVANVFPEARFVHVVRDGLDVVESSMRQWTARPDPSYLLAKARHFPVRLAPRYAARYAIETVRRLRDAPEQAPPVWGPRYEGIDADSATLGLPTVCARQWSRCVMSSLEGLTAVRPDRQVAVRFEEFVADPLTILQTTVDVLELPAPAKVSNLPSIIEGRVGHGRCHLADREVDAVMDEIASAQAAVETSFARPPEA